MSDTLNISLDAISSACVVFTALLIALHAMVDESP